MIEKVNPSHPDKLADRISGAIVDLAYKKSDNPKIAVEVLTGHKLCTIIIETSEKFKSSEIKNITDRILGNVRLNLKVVSQDTHLFDNQRDRIKCGDNGIFKGVPLTKEEIELSKIAHDIYKEYPYDGKYILDNNKLVICQSNVDSKILKSKYKKAIINPLGDWTGGINVDSGATNRKLGSDMGHSITGGGLHGKDLSKADVAINIYVFLKAQKLKKEVNLSCAIGDEYVDGVPYEEIVNIAKNYIDKIGGFEKFAEWGLF